MRPSYQWQTQLESCLALGQRTLRSATHKDTHKLRTLRGTSRHRVTRRCRRLNHQKSFIQKSFGISRHLVTQRVKNTRKAASLGLEPRQRDPESLVLPLHHEAKARGTRSKAQFARCASRSKTDLVTINPGSFRHLRARLRPQCNFRF